jgi:predicted phosphohydrolase
MSDFHLYNSTDKPMDIFGYKWKDHMKKIKFNWPLSEEDIIIMPGDLSWGLKPEEALSDFQFIEELPGKKILIKGNHDMWWGSTKKLKTLLEPYSSIDFIFNNSIDIENIGICGTRGWDIESNKENDVRIVANEAARLERSILSSEANNKIVFLHYPPVTKKKLSSPIFDIIKKYNIKYVYFGHLHGEAINNAILGEYEGVILDIVASDQIDFIPKKVIQL